jgi:hypothetical protein
MREDIRIGVNGIIAGNHPSAFDAASVATLRAIIDEGEFQSNKQQPVRSSGPQKPFRSFRSAKRLAAHAALFLECISQR